MKHEEYTIVKDKLFFNVNILPSLRGELVRIVLNNKAHLVVIGYVLQKSDEYALWINNVSGIKSDKPYTQITEYKPDRIAELQVITDSYNKDIEPTVNIYNSELVRTHSLILYHPEVFRENEAYIFHKDGMNLIFNVLEVFDDESTLAIQIPIENYEDLCCMTFDPPKEYDVEGTYTLCADNIRPDVEINSIIAKYGKVPEFTADENGTFDFPTAIKHLLEGKKVRPTTWTDCGYETYLDYDWDTRQVFNEKGMTLDIMQFSRIRDWELVD